MPDDIFQRSLWYATAAPAPETVPLAGALKADVAVIGAGYTGLSCALHLAEAGTKAVVVEAGEIGEGASGRNNGQVIPTLSRVEPNDLDEGFARLVCDSASFTFDLIRRHGMQCEAVQNGWVQPAHSPGRLRLTERRAREWGLLGAPVEMLDRDGIERVTGSRFWYGGWANKTGGKLNPLAYCRELARCAIAAGAVVHTQSPARRIERAGLRWRIECENGSVTAERVVVATHATTRGLWPGLAQSVFPVRSYQMATAPIPEPERRSVLPYDHACSDTRGDLYFFRWDAHGRLVTGGALAMPWNWEARQRERIGRRVSAVFPKIGVPVFDYLWFGHVGVTLDRRPHVHELGPGVLAWVGCNGRGVGLAGAIGAQFARACLGTPPGELPLPFTPLAPVFGHAVGKHLRGLGILYYRLRDAREV
ncbi:MAG: FAD-binding oxidoreductase [Burkholderiales bacterium]|nr:FAD-binding oxidoreductase [Burkholderiales bacterium]